MLSRPTLMASLGALLLGLAAPNAHAQRYYGVDLVQRELLELTPYPGCPGPWPFYETCSLAASACGVPSLGGVPPGSLLGDVAADRVNDTVLVTDGLVVYEFVGDTPCGSPAPCTALSAFEVPASLGMGPLTGMGLDASGSLTSGTPTLWVTDGTSIAGLGYGPCSVSVLVPPCVVADTVPGATITDVAWNTGTVFGQGLFACDDFGAVYFIDMPGCTVSWLTAPACVVPPLTGIAYDVTTPNAVDGTPDSIVVTDGNGLAYMNVPSGFDTPFHHPIDCTTAAFPGNESQGLAMNLHGVNMSNWVPELGDMHVDAFGSSVSPSPGFGLEVHNVPPDTWVVGVANSNTAVPSGYICPPLLGLGAEWLVDPFISPGVIMFFGSMGPGCNVLPAALPPGLPVGYQVYVQFIAFPLSGPLVAEAYSEAIALTIGEG